MTLPEFLEALNAMSYVHEELRPKTEAEIATRLAEQTAKMAQRARRREP